jgi:hypothetical protein
MAIKTTERLGDAPIEPQYLEMMNKIAAGLDKIFNGNKKGKDRETGFVLLVFPFENEHAPSDGRANFISNGADRKDVVVLFKEMIKRFEGQPEMKGRA